MKKDAVNAGADADDTKPFDCTAWYESRVHKLEAIGTACRVSHNVLSDMLVYEKMRNGMLVMEKESFPVLQFVRDNIMTLEIPVSCMAH